MCHVLTLFGGEDNVDVLDLEAVAAPVRVLDGDHAAALGAARAHEDEVVAPDGRGGRVSAELVDGHRLVCGVLAQVGDGGLVAHADLKGLQCGQEA